jgi:transposase
MSKSETIKNTLKATKQRRETQDCKVYTCKFDFSHLSKQKKEYLNRLFLEAKWLRNYIIARDDIFNETDKHTSAIVRNKDGEQEERKLKFLSSQMKQGILDQIKNDISGLSASKGKGRRVGKLKFKSRVNSIGLKQFDNTYKIKDKSHIILQGFKMPFRVNGLKQIPSDAEMANAKLLRKPSGYYIAITCYVPKTERTKTGKEIGFDFGIGTHITDTEGRKDTWNFVAVHGIRRIFHPLA